MVCGERMFETVSAKFMPKELMISFETVSVSGEFTPREMMIPFETLKIRISDQFQYSVHLPNFCHTRSKWVA